MAQENHSDINAGGPAGMPGLETGAEADAVSLQGDVPWIDAGPPRVNAAAAPEAAQAAINDAGAAPEAPKPEEPSDNS